MPQPDARGFRVGESVLALVLVALGAWIAVETARLPVVATYARIGPKLFPWLVAGGLGLTGLALLYEAWRSEVPRLRRLEWQPLALVSAGLVAQMLLLEPAGFVLASAVLFVTVAMAFGNFRVVLNGAIGLALSLAVYVAFTRGLGLHLPAGFLGALW